jgi:hypothetical protein
MNLAERIPDGATVLVDTNPIIYVLEGHRLADRFADIFADASAGRIQAIVSPGCHALITHDRDFGRVDEVLILG